ncbi:MAG: glycosyltransferase family 2 protein [Anaerolineaceae bacterium]|nr:glycosyltransferase family 2 protein [Anaerolineaceae bacterium]
MIDWYVMTVWVVILKVIYTVCMFVLFAYGVHSVCLSVIYYINRRHTHDLDNLPQPVDWPRVTIQLPIYNEQFLIEKQLQTVVNLDYPRNRLQIQVLDDSTDFTTELARAQVERYCANGFDVQFRHRTNRRGFKAGALAAATLEATGNLIAIFDADFLPPRDWLKRVVPVFENPKIGFVQTRWGHMNDKQNLLTRMLSLALDGHFMVEQNARYTGDLLMGFNGSGGIWRKQAIEDAGGWQSDTLTEDLDLSYRAQMAGWHPGYMSQVVVPGKVPWQMASFNTQQYRWSKGSIQTTRKLFGKVMHSDFSLKKRLFGVFHLSMYLPFLFMVITLLLVLPVGLVDPRYFIYFPWTVCASIAPPLMYALAKTERVPRLIDRVVLMPPMIIMGVGLSVNCALGVVSGMLYEGGVFEVTPKLEPQVAVVNKKHKTRMPITVWGELAMGAYLVTTVYVLWPTAGLALAPWLLSSALGYFGVAAVKIYQYLKRSRLSSQKQDTHRRPVVNP